MNTIRKQAKGFRSKIQRRNRLELVAGGLALAGVLPVFFMEVRAGMPPFVLVGYLVLLAGVLYVMVTIRRRGAVHGVEEQLHKDARSFAHAYRTALDSQASLARSAWRWYVLPLLSPVLVLHLAKHVERGGTLSGWLLEPGYVHVVALLGVGISLLNRFSARKLGRLSRELSQEFLAPDEPPGEQSETGP